MRSYDIYILLNLYCEIFNMSLIDGFHLLRNFSVAISVSPHVCFILVLILISML